MEVAIESNTKSPFQKEIREWQHVDPNTGALINSRLEADRWVNGPLNTYGKMISHNLSTPDGTQHTHRKQMEILQARTSSGSLQVVRAQTVQTSSSRWSSSGSTTAPPSAAALANGDSHSNGLKAITSGYSNGHATPVHLSDLLHSAAMGNGGLHDLQSAHHNGHAKTNGFHHHQHHPDQKQSTNVRSSAVLPTPDGKLNKFDDVGGNVYRNNMTKHMYFNQNFNNCERENHITTESSFVRGKSISIEDLSADRNELNFDDDVEPSEWKRVSKIRRSLQFPRSTAQKVVNTRPPDLPENSVSVWKLKQEIENGRRLSTAMRNNHVDFVALDNILKGVADLEPKAEPRPSKKATIITAESLKEIRGKLRRLSDESLYKDDMSPTEDSNHTDFDMHSSPPKENDNVFTQQRTSAGFFNSNSLESKIRKDKDGSQDDWNSRERRKSYGFEKMKVPAETLEKMESSTDSGLGRSSDLNSLWSPTDATPGKGTIVTLGDQEIKRNSSSTSIALFNGNHEIRQHNYNLTKTYEKPEENKRHSIAVDETHYVRENLRKVFDGKSLIHLNGAYTNDEINASHEGFLDENGRKSKRVEFCKTEIHFAAESGRVNIVETDGKPPPTNNFRRRRRSSGSSYLEKPSLLFGSNEKLPVVVSDRVAEPDIPKEEPKITVFSTTTTTSSSTSTIEDFDLHSEDISLRGILKNKPAKPKPYHLGENLENNDTLWGVRLRPVSNEFTSWKAPTEHEEQEEHNEMSKPQKSQILIKDKEEPIIHETGFSTKISLVADPADVAWQQPKESFTPKITTTTNNSNHEMSTTTISIGITPSSITTTPVPKCVVDAVKLRSPIEPSDELRSTSLIIRTLKSTSQFDEALRQLNDSSIADHFHGSGSAFQLVSTSLPKSNSASCILQRSYPKVLPMAKYSSSLDGDCILNSEGEDCEYEGYTRRSSIMTNTLYETSSLSAEEKSRDEVNLSRLANFKSFISQNYSEMCMESKKPIAAPRLKKLESSNVLSHQLSQLRRMYDAAEESDDSAKADEEVNLYLGNLGGEKPAVEVVSGSWSRIKAKKTNRPTEVPDSENIRSIHSNKMSIELHSPASSRRAKTTTLLLAPVAQPRKVVPAQQYRPDFDNEPVQHTKEELRNLKLSPGTRQLRDHELTFFGVRKSQAAHKARSPPVTPTAASNFAKKLTPSLLTVTKTPTSTLQPQQRTDQVKMAANCHIDYGSNDKQWQLDDKPDLLKHSTSADLKTTTPSSSYNKATSNQHGWRGVKPEARHRVATPTKVATNRIYENMTVVKPKYDRKSDLQRDEEILDELSRAADEIMNTVKEFTEAEEKKKRNRDSARVQTRPLDTISEKSQMQNIAKSRAARDVDDLSRRTHRLCRISSASSNESISKSSSTHSKQSNGSLRRSSVTAATTASLNHRVESHSNSSSKSNSRKKTATTGEGKRILRTSSREKLLSQASSSEDLPNHKVEAPRRPRRLKTTKERDTKSDAKKTDHSKLASGSSRHRSDKPIGPHKVHRTTEATITSKSSRVSSSTDSKGRSRTAGRTSTTAQHPAQTTTVTTSRRSHR